MSRNIPLILNRTAGEQHFDLNQITDTIHCTRSYRQMNKETERSFFILDKVFLHTPRIKQT